MSTLTGIRTAAYAAHAAGLCVIPPREDGSKRPDAPEWTAFQRQHPTREQLTIWFGHDRMGLGVVTGRISGNLELFEYDDAATYETYKASAGAVGLGGLIERIERGYSETTPGGGIR